jgi:TolB-like protein
VHVTRRKPAADDIELDLRRYELRRSGCRVKLERKPMELLVLLAHRQGQLVTRQEIESRLWGPDSSIDTGCSINNSVRKIRAALGDDSARPRVLETVFGKGYRFIGTVRVISGLAEMREPGYAASVATPGRDERSSYQQSSLVVLPFQFLNEAVHQRGLSLGFADALISALGNLEGFCVLPTAAVMKYAGDTDPATVARRFGVRFVLQGTIQGEEPQWRISVQVFDAAKQRIALAQTYDATQQQVFEIQDEIALRVADSLNQRFRGGALRRRDRYSKDPLAYAAYMKGYGGSSSSDPQLLDQSERHLDRAVAQDPKFALAHAMLSYVCANKHFEFDPSRVWLEKAELHAQRALKLDPDMPEAHLAYAYILWGPAKNFQHLQAIAELQRALTLQPNLPHAHNRLGAILAHIGLLEDARHMYEEGRYFEPRGAMSHGITTVYLWSGEYDSAREQIESWRAESPGSKYPAWFAPQPALMEGEYDEARTLIQQAARLMPEEPLVISLQGLLHAVTGEAERALRCVKRACESPKSFGHAHHTYYQIACTHAVLHRPQPAMEWLEKAVETGLACWPLFLRDPSLRNLQQRPEFELLIKSLQTKYSDVKLRLDATTA